MLQEPVSPRPVSGEPDPSGDMASGHARVLVVDGDRRLPAALRRGLLLHSFNILMPGIDGMSLCRLARETETTPILMLTARDGVPDHVAGLEADADDHRIKPFDELVARLQALSAAAAQALLRRSGYPTRI